MDFGFLPFQLNADLSDFSDNIEYLSSDNGVDLYKINIGNKETILGFPSNLINLYFFEGSLVTVYYHLEETQSSFERLKKSLEGILIKPGTPFMMEDAYGVFWTSQVYVLAVVVARISNKFYLYSSLKQYSVI